MGDFNAITSIDDHKGGSFYYYAKKASLFNNFISDNALIDMGFLVRCTLSTMGKKGNREDGLVLIDVW